MVGVHDLPMFVVAGLLLAMSPGPDTAYILGRSAQHGWCGGAVAALGIAVGIWVHILGAAAGLSALLVASASAFTVAKLAGAAYLLYLGGTGHGRTGVNERYLLARLSDKRFESE